MIKKLLPVFVLGLFILSACGSGAKESVISGDRMPCSTVYDYVVSEDTQRYQDAADQQPPITEDDWVYGDFEAPITIVEYADFQCPACVGFSLGVKELINEFPNSIRVVFRHLPLPSIHPLAYISGMAAEAAGAQGKFWEMHDLLYQKQDEWNTYTEDEFKEWAVSQAEALELDVDKFDEVLNDQDLRAELEQINVERLALGMHYTPFVVINDCVWRENKPDLYGLVGIYEFGGYEECPPWVIEEGKTYLAQLDTSAGQIDIELFPDAAPLAVNSFVFLAQEGWYDDLYFHRVIEDFIAQSGDPSGMGYFGPGYTFVNEINDNLSFDSKGVVGMANPGTDVNGSQFFITLDAVTDLDGKYTVFGQVTEETLPVLDEITRGESQSQAVFEDATIIYGITIIEE